MAPRMTWWCVATFALAATGARALDITLPTPNQALFDGGGSAFYMYVNRDFEGDSSHPWQGGQYGFWRNPIRTSSGILYTRFHEGLDIRPVKRDASGEPLDPVWAIADGKVVYANDTSSHSNYGKYIVIEHTWDGCPYYSLYGHLKSIAVRKGDAVGRSQIIGALGYTGVGIDRSRAHVHIEINLLANRKFDSWHEKNMKEPNWHGIYNGLNLFGLDPARLFIENRKNPKLTITQFLAGEETFYKVRIPNPGTIDILTRYPWLCGGIDPASPPAWEISFTKSGLPLRFRALAEPVSGPQLAEVKSTSASPYYQTLGRVTRSGSKTGLTENGLRFLRVFTWPD
jgi:murein DD-endopeptidase MepM/ murein hydrolase activator NlpD